MRTRYFLAIILALIGGLAATPSYASPLTDCAQHIPWGAPTVTDGAHVDLVCHAGYLSGLDGGAKVPRWVAYDLTGPHTLGCFPRTGLNFQVDALAPAEDQGKRSDYSHTPYDLGHMAPNQDFAWDQGEQRDTFSFANVAPQLAGLNRQGWERGEEYIRAWALQRGHIEVYVGVIMTPGDKKLGKSRVDIPVAFYKVAVDPATNEAIGFVMKQKDTKKQPLDPFITPISQIEADANVTLPLPAGYTEGTTAWHGDLAGWKKAKKAACAP